jgi:hypothetical protein
VARKKSNNQWYLLETNEITIRKYGVEATSAREARSSDDRFDDLLGAIDDDPHPKIVRATGFATREEAEESDDAWVQWSN